MIAERLGVTPSQLALAWLLTREGVIAIPKTSQRARLRETLAALEVRLAPEHLAALDRMFPPPDRKVALQMY